MNGTGPEGKGPKSGRGLGKCKNGSKDDSRQQPGKGMGKHHRAGKSEGRGRKVI